MDLCHLKNSELEPQFQKYEGRVELRGDIVKDDSGSYATFPEQGSSASQMTAAKVMDVISRLPGCAGQAAHSRAQSGNFCNLITTDHKVLSEGCESRNNHRYAVVAQNLATQWLQSYLCKTKTSQEPQKM